MTTEGLVFERGARFLVGSPHPTASVSAFTANAARHPQVQKALQGSRWRLLGVQSEDEMDDVGDRNVCRACEAIYYDYTRNRTVRVRGAASGRGPVDIRVTTEQPVPSPQEFAAAAELVRRHPVWGPMLAAGQVRVYRPMPPVREPDLGEVVDRTLFVGLISQPRKFNRIIPVNMVTGEVSSSGDRPWRAAATEQICGVPDELCFSAPRGTPGSVIIEWPADNPVWRFQAIRPTASTGCNGSGVELRDVKYLGRPVLKQAHVPILNVQYPTSQRCGPYRDWLYEETCFEAIGENIPGAPGFRWCSQPALTISETGVDGGNFQGVAVYEDTDGALVLVSVCSAGWYRYIPEWRFYPDGRIQPRFKFGAVADSCVCESHNHHAYWRFHFRILNNRMGLEELQGENWVLQRREIGFFRDPKIERRWRVRNWKKRTTGYEIIPGAEDGVGDDYSGDDQFALLYNRNQIDDRHCDVTYNTEQGIWGYLNNAPINNRDLVVWYAAHFSHNVHEDGDAHAVAIGPTLQPFGWPLPPKKR